MPDLEIEITPVSVDDIRDIQGVFYTVWLATYPNDEHGITVDDLKYRYRDMFTPETLEKRRKMIREKTNNELFLVAKNLDKVVGVCYAEKDATRNELRAMYVLPQFQRKGIGALFWKEAQNFFNHSKDIAVNVVVYNSNAINFYKGLGFIDTGKRFTEERFRMRNGSIMPEMEMVIRAGE